MTPRRTIYYRIMAVIIVVLAGSVIIATIRNNRFNFVAKSRHLGRISEIVSTSDTQLVVSGMNLSNQANIKKLMPDGTIDSKFETNFKNSSFVGLRPVKLSTLPDASILVLAEEGAHGMRRLLRIRSDGEADVAFSYALDALGAPNGAVGLKNGRILTCVSNPTKKGNESTVLVLKASGDVEREFTGFSAKCSQINFIEQNPGSVLVATPTETFAISQASWKIKLLTFLENYSLYFKTFKIVAVDVQGNLFATYERAVNQRDGNLVRPIGKTVGIMKLKPAGEFQEIVFEAWDASYKGTIDFVKILPSGAVLISGAFSSCGQIVGHNKIQREINTDAYQHRTDCDDLTASRITPDGKFDETFAQNWKGFAIRAATQYSGATAIAAHFTGYDSFQNVLFLLDRIRQRINSAANPLNSGIVLLNQNGEMISWPR